MVKTMIKVRTGGCGITYTDDNGVARHVLKTIEDGPFECEIEQAKRFVSLGVAEYVSDEKADEGAQKGAHLDAEQLETMTNDQLKALAAEMGVEVKGCKNKADLIAAITAAEVEPGDDPEGDGPPNLDPVDPE